MKIFLDSGAHSLYVKHKKDLTFYTSKEFWAYVNSYAEFVKANLDKIDVYVNVDVIRNAELTKKVQKHLEKEHGLSPLPVYHTGENIKDFKYYFDRYEYIGIGGLGQGTKKSAWTSGVGDPVFRMVCPPPDYIPIRKIHGFAMTSPDLIARYPFYSVDSTSWAMYGKYAIIIVPRTTALGKYDYKKPPLTINVSQRLHRQNDESHCDYMTPEWIRKVFRYIKEKNFTWEELMESGKKRDEINMQYYLDLKHSLPEWPYRWSEVTTRKFKEKK